MNAAAHSPAALAAAIRERAIALGFDAAGIARLAPLEAQRHYERWLAAGFHGGMDWLASDEHRARRADPALILPGVRAVVCVALFHEPGRDAARDRRLGRIARYAAGEDYHAVMKDRLGALQRAVEDDLAPGATALWYADTGAILERGWAERAGLGWTGKHSGLITADRGSWFLLGELLVDRDLEPDAPLEREHCGTCARCLDACPTRAIVAPYRVDARRCLSYLTIEHRGAIPHEFRRALGDWVFGCDVCQEVCPWNRFAAPAREARLHARSLEGWTLERLLALDDAGFAERFAASPIRRAGREGFARNVCVALGNLGRETPASLAPSAAGALVRALAADPSSLVRAHAAWALGEIAGAPGAPDAARAAARDALRTALAYDADAGVRAEARAALGGSTEAAS